MRTTWKDCKLVNMEDEIGKTKAKIGQLEQILDSDRDVDKEEKKLIRNQIIESTKTLNLLLAQQGKCISDFFFLFCFNLSPIYLSSYPAPNSAPQLHLHIELSFGTPIPCLQLEQVMIRLGTFLPTLCVISFMFSVHEWTTKLFPVFLDCFTFHLFAFAVLFSSFFIALLYTPITSPI